MNHLNPVIAQALQPWAPPAAPRFAHTSCSQCGRDTGPGDAGHSSCATHTPTPTECDLSDLEDFEYVTGNGLVLRCYLQYSDAIDGGNDSPSSKERADLMFAFAGITDVFELVERIPGLQAEIEAEYLADLRRQDAEEIAEFNRARAEEITRDRMECEA